MCSLSIEIFFCWNMKSENHQSSSIWELRLPQEQRKEEEEKEEQE